jgi:predicted nucleic-acid-binding protein
VRAVDTNVLIRFFMDDDTNQAATARRFFEASKNQRESLLITPHVLCELVWVLSASFQLAKSEVVEIAQGILMSDIFVIERETMVQGALLSYRRGRADFSDYLTGEIASAAGCRDTATFDKALKGAHGFTLL